MDQGKSFNDFLSAKENYTDFEKPVQETRVEEPVSQWRQNLSIYGSSFLSSLGLSLITAPVFNASVILQTSEKISSQSKQQFFIDQSKKEIQKMSKDSRLVYEKLIQKNIFGQKRPFYKPSYQKYSQVFQDLAQQGIKGFYKGNLIGLFLINLQNFGKIHFLMQIDQRSHQSIDGINPISVYFQKLIGICLIDVILHPLHMMQTRFIYQNRLLNKRVYKGVIDYCKQQFKKRSFFKGVSMNLPINLIYSCQIFDPQQQQLEYLSFTIFLSCLVYPLTTVQRRLEIASQNRQDFVIFKNENYLKYLLMNMTLRDYFRGILGQMGIKSLTFSLVLSHALQQEISFDKQLINTIHQIEAIQQLIVSLAEWLRRVT